MTAPDSIPLQFQILGSAAGDVAGEYQITLYGSTAEGKSVGVAVTGFEPFFYIEIPDTWSAKAKDAYKAYLKQRLRDKEQAQVRLTIEKHKSFWDFNNDELLTFVKVQAKSKRVWTKIRDICQDRETCLPIPYRAYTLRVFEANIDPMLRFFHLRELKPAGWAAIAEDKYNDLDKCEEDDDHEEDEDHEEDYDEDYIENVDILENSLSDIIDTDYINNEIYHIFPVLSGTIVSCVIFGLFLSVFK
jgi:hypothetical protein